MSERQRIRNPKANFTIIPNMYDEANLTVYEFRLLIHYRRVGNCYESTRTTSKKCRMSLTSVIKGRRGLADKGWISLNISEQKTISIVVVDRWSGTPTFGGTIDDHKSVPKMEHADNNDPPVEQLDPKMESDCPPGGIKEVLIKKDSLRSTKPTRAKNTRGSNNRIRKVLQDEFMLRTNLKPPLLETEAQKKAAGSSWWAPLREIAELVEWREMRGRRLIARVVKHMRDEKLLIADPRSIVKVARSIVAEGTEKSITGSKEFLDALRRP